MAYPMAVRISGAPSWASTAPSANSTMEWITDWGCTTASSASGAMPNR